MTTGADGELAASLYLGVGPTYATNAVGSPADIIAVTDTRFLADTETTSLLTLTANDDAKVAAAWIEVRAPATAYTPAGGSIQLDPILTRVILNPPIPGVLDNWYTTYDQFLLDATVYLQAFENLRVYVRGENLTMTQAVAARRPFGARPSRPFQLQVGVRVTP